MKASLIVLFITIAAATAASLPLEENSPDIAIARFYNNAAQIFRVLQPISSEDPSMKTDSSMEYYQLLLGKEEYGRILDNSLIVTNIPVLERTITFHSQPNFEKVGSRYLYHRRSSNTTPIEVELIDAKDRLFRQVKPPQQYLYITSLNKLEYLNEIPIKPYYEVIFKCNISNIPQVKTRAGIVSYVDRSYQWNPRYSLEIPKFLSNEEPTLTAFADVTNNNEFNLLIKDGEFIYNDLSLLDVYETFSEETISAAMRYLTSPRGVSTIQNLNPFNKPAKEPFIYRFYLPQETIISPGSVKSIPILTPTIDFKPFVSYSSVFSTSNITGKLQQSYNISTVDANLPTGPLAILQQGRFIGEIELPEIHIGEIHTIKAEYDADISYQRTVKKLHIEDGENKTIYKVQYIFRNLKPATDVHLTFSESFPDRYNVNITNVSHDDVTDSSRIQIEGKRVFGEMIIPYGGESQTFTYQVILNENALKPIIYKRRCANDD